MRIERDQIMEESASGAAVSGDQERAPDRNVCDLGMISDERIPEDRRVQYALEGIAGVRHGEAAAIRIRSFNPHREPLGCLTVRVPAPPADGTPRARRRRRP